MMWYFFPEAYVAAFGYWSMALPVSQFCHFSVYEVPSFFNFQIFCSISSVLLDFDSLLKLAHEAYLVLKEVMQRAM